MNILYFGSDVFISCFEYFLSEHNIIALYTYHNDEDYFTEYSIAKLAEANGIPVHYETITPERIERYFEDEGCDLLFIAEYDRILKLPTDLSSFRGINTHSSLLPEGRSYYPIEAAMERGLTRTGVTMHKLTAELDKGSIIAAAETTVTPDTDSIDVYLANAANARRMIEDIINNFDERWNAASAQLEKHPYWKRPCDELLTLTHDMTTAEAREIFRKYNSMTQLEIDGKWYYVTALDTGRAVMLKEHRFLAKDRLLWKVNNGNLRLVVHPMEV